MKKLLDGNFGIAVTLFAATLICVALGGLAGLLTEQKAWGTAAAGWAQAFGALMAFAAAFIVPLMVRSRERKENRRAFLACMEITEATFPMMVDYLEGEIVSAARLRTFTRNLSVLRDALERASEKTTGETNLHMPMTGMRMMLLEVEDILTRTAAEGDFVELNKAKRLGFGIRVYHSLLLRSLAMARAIIFERKFDDPKEAAEAAARVIDVASAEDEVSAERPPLPN